MNYKTFFQRVKPLGKRLIVWPWMGVLIIVIVIAMPLFILGMFATAIIDDLAAALVDYDLWLDS